MELVDYHNKNFSPSYILDPFVIPLHSSLLLEYPDDYQPVAIVEPESLSQPLKRNKFSALNYTEILHTQT